MKCVHLIISGNVQGVFFRANAKKEAIHLGLKGFARNLDNGNVEIIAEGDAMMIGEFVQFLRNSPGSSKVENIHMSQKDLEHFKDFEIK